MRFDFNYCGSVSGDLRALIAETLRRDFPSEEAAWAALFGAAREAGYVARDGRCGGLDSVTMFQVEEVTR